MIREGTRRAVAKFLAADEPGLDKLQFLKLLAVLGRQLGRGRLLEDEDREAAIQLVIDQSPLRSWHKSRVSEVRLVLNCYLDFDQVLRALQKGGGPFDYHDVLKALRRQRDGRSIPTKKRRNSATLPTALSRVARSRGLSVQRIDTQPDKIVVTFIYAQ